MNADKIKTLHVYGLFVKDISIGVECDDQYNLLFYIRSWHHRWVMNKKVEKYYRCGFGFFNNTIKEVNLRLSMPITAYFFTLFLAYDKEIYESE